MTMSLSRVVIRNPVGTPAQLKQYVDWLKSHPSGAGANLPASVGLMMALDVPLEFGPDVAVSSRGLQPEIIYFPGKPLDQRRDEPWRSRLCPVQQ
jgi:hypothetical protein